MILVDEQHSFFSLQLQPKGLEPRVEMEEAMLLLLLAVAVAVLVTTLLSSELTRILVGLADLIFAATAAAAAVRPWEAAIVHCSSQEYY